MIFCNIKLFDWITRSPVIRKHKKKNSCVLTLEGTRRAGLTAPARAIHLTPPPPEARG